MEMESGMLFNNLLWIGFILLNLGLVTLVYRFFGKNGLYAIIVSSIIAANILVVKTVQILNVIFGA